MINMDMKYLLIIIILLVSCQKDIDIKEKHTFYRMNTIIDITLVVSQRNKNAEKIEDTWKKIDSLLSDWEVRFSQTHPESEVLKINRDTTATRRVSSVLSEMIDICLRFGDTLNGSFDLTVLPVKKLWGFGEQDTTHDSDKVAPTYDTIQKALQRVDYRALSVDIDKKEVTFKDPQTVIDVGGVAKGYALYELGKLLDRMEYTDYLIVAGGDILGRGKRPDGNSWKVAIKHPRKSTKLLGAFRLDSGSVVTSGDYERFWTRDGKRYHHIFNTKTGYCCTRNQSLTVWGMDPITVDVLSTGLFGLPKDSIFAFIENRPSLECALVDSSGSVFISEGWRGKVEIFD